MKKKLLLLALVSFAFLNSCMEQEYTGCPVPYPLHLGVHEIYNTWAFVGFRNKETGILDYPPCELYINDGVKVTLGRIKITFTDEPSLLEEWGEFERFLGSGPVNIFFGHFKLQESNQIISSGGMGFTEIGSVHRSVSDYESRLFSALIGMTEYKIIQNRLSITYGDGSEEMWWILMDN
jgi:hypothetical protein